MYNGRLRDQAIDCARCGARHATRGVVTRTMATSQGVPKERGVLEEDAYLQTLNRIIEKDFFPDLPKLRNQLEWLDALERDDVDRMRQIQERMTTGRASAAPTPARSNPSATPRLEELSAAELHQQVEAKALKAAEKLRLDAFQARYTSEDNHAFDKLMEAAAARKREKYAWLYKAQDEQQVLLLEGPGMRPSEQAQPLTWQYQAKNQLMYVPDGVPFTAAELAERNRGPAPELVHANTRLPVAPPASASAQSTPSRSPAPGAESAASRLAAPWRTELSVASRDRIDLDDLQAGGPRVPQSPRVGAYSLLPPPSPAPGVTASPLVTWGDVMGTPLRLDAPEPHGKGPSFKVPETPRRDQLMLQLAEEAAAKKRPKTAARDQKRKLTDLASPARAPRTPGAMSFDAQLRASYASPMRKPTTPLFPITPTPRAPSAAATPLPAAGAEKKARPASVTDGLLNI